MSRIAFGLVAAIIANLIGAAIMTKAMAAEEIPEYEVVSEHDDNIEIRRYAPMLLAEVTVTGARSEAANKAFRILANYIFGDNQAQTDIAMTAPVTQTQSEKIDMTAPVTQTPQGDGVWRVAFMMPSKYTEETIPLPNDDRITLRTKPEHQAVAIRFSGRWTRTNIAKHQDQLDAFVAAQSLAPAGAAIYAFYNGPFTPFFLRRNEIIYELVSSE